MKVSVVIPAHNEEERIADIIAYIRAQDYPDFEIIVVNNASTDNTFAIASELGVRVVNEPQKGLLSARERGRLNAIGEIIANVDADCAPAKDWITRGVRYFADEKVIAVSGPYDYHDASFFLRTFLWTGFLFRKLITLVTRLPGFEYGGALVGGNTMIRSSVLTHVGGYDTSLVFFGEEASIVKRIASYGKIVHSLRFVMKTSARRFQQEGVWSLSYDYLVNIFGKK